MEIWNYVVGSYTKTISPTELVETNKTIKFYEQILRKTISESWTYDYSKYMVINDIPKQLKNYTSVIDESTIKEWSVLVTAKEIMQQNAEVIAAYGPTPNASVTTTTTLDGKPYSSDMIYGAKREADAYRIKMLSMSMHTPDPPKPPEPPKVKSSIFGSIGSWIGDKVVDGVNDAVKKAVDSVTEFKDEALAITHVALDTGGLFPVLGAIPDALNAVIYIAEGDYKNAGLSLFSALPIVGYAGTGIKYGSKILQARKATQTVQEARRVTNVYSPGSLRLDLQFFGKGKGNDIAKEPFVPDEYWRKKAPQNATPGSKIDHYRDYNGKTEKSTVIYDNFGRQKYRIDHSDHSMPKDHSVPHLHEYKYGPGYHPEKGMEFRYNFWRIK